MNQPGVGRRLLAVWIIGVNVIACAALLAASVTSCAGGSGTPATTTPPGPSSTLGTEPPPDMPVIAGAATPADNGDREVITAGAGGLHCGYERWSVKTGTDSLASRVNLTPRPATVAQLSALRSPLPPVPKNAYPPQVARQPAEMQAYTLVGTITAYTAEQDADLHLVLTAGSAHMIVEIPNPGCVKGGPFVAGIANARATFLGRTGYTPPIIPKGQYNPVFVHTSLHVTVVGILFFDFPHGQYGVARNGVELHPLTSISFG